MSNELFSIARKGIIFSCISPSMPELSNVPHLRYRQKQILSKTQWRNDAPGAPATPGGAVLGGRQIVIKMWDNFARLTALLAKVRVWLSNLTIYLDFFGHFFTNCPQ